MNLHFLQHVPFEGLASIETWANSKDATITSTKLYENANFPEIDNIDLLVIMGGPMGIYDYDEYPWLHEEKKFIKTAIASDVKILGVCLGAQLLADALGSKVYPNQNKEIGWFPIDATLEGQQTKIGSTLPETCEVFHWHGDTFDLPPNAVHLFRSVACENQAYLIDDRILGFQFHLETTNESATKLIENCRHEIIDAPYIQTETDMLANPNKFQKINNLMTTTLDQLMKLSG